MTKTKLISQAVEEAYKRIVTDHPGEQDLLRISFLEEVAEGIVERQEKWLRLEDAVAAAEEKDPDSTESKNYRAKQAMREWYLHPGTERKEEALTLLTEANLSYLANSFPECLQVLKASRIRELRAAFAKAFTVKDEVRTNTETGTKYSLRENAIYAAAETLIASGIPELEKHAVTEMSKYKSQKNYHPPGMND